MQERDLNRIKKFYKFITPVFKLISKYLQREYRSVLKTLLVKVKIDVNTSLLDVGTGTGGLAGLFLDYTSHITGVDFSPEMLAEARKKYGDRITFLQKAAHEIADFETDSYDIVTAAYSLHDMDNQYRLQVLQEMRRIAKHNVVIIDFIKNKSLLVRAVEALEGSFYIDFVNSIDAQLTEVFPNYERIAVSKTMGLYICEV